MSTKNFVSYGDAETLFTGVGNKLSAINSELTNKLDSSVYAQFGCKNLNAYPYAHATRESHGITFTDNGDGSITVSGTNDGTDTSEFDCHSKSQTETNTLVLPNGKYIISGCPNGGSNTTYSVSAQCLKNGTTVTLGHDYGNGALVVLDGDDYSSDKVDIQFRIVIRRNQSFSEPVTFYPMIRPAGVADGTWEPYVKSNKQLTDGLASVESGKTDTDIVASDFDSTASYTAGNYCIYEGKFYKFKANHSGAWSAADVDEIQIAGELSSIKSGLNDVNSNLSAKADLTDLAPAFSDNTAYTVGQYVSYEGSIYQCTSAHSAGAWVAGDFTLVAVGSELSKRVVGNNAALYALYNIGNDGYNVYFTDAGQIQLIKNGNILWSLNVPT